MRLFVAIPIPILIAQQLQLLAGGVPNMRWVPQENYHITLRFLGEVDGRQFHDLDAALAGIHAPAFDLQCRGVDCFSSGSRVKTLWVGIEKSASLQHLRDKIESASVRAGFKPNGHKFTPHVTLAYAKDQVPLPRLQSYMAHHNLFRSPTFGITHFVLFSSQLGGESSVYHAERVYALLPKREEQIIESVDQNK